MSAVRNTTTKRQAIQTLRCVLIIVCAAVFCAGLRVDAQDSANDAPAKGAPVTELFPQIEPAGERTVEYWAEQLSSDHYLRRATAKQRLIAAGNAAVPVLEKALIGGDLETTELAIGALGEIAMQQPPNDDTGAWSAINRIATRSAGSKASRAKLVADEINEYRSTQAQAALVAAGVMVGIDDFVIQAVSETHMIVQIDDRWRGDIESLDWLRWLRNIQYARIQGAAVNPDVMKRLVKMPDLRTIMLLDGTVDEATLRPLDTMRSIQSLEFRYTKLTEPLADQIAQLPLRASLSLMGTDLPSAKVATMREALPGLKIEYKQGGFLGVQCTDGFNVCQVNGITNGSAAQKAGLQPGDIIVRMDDRVVKRFSDLQEKISEHSAGDELSLEFERGTQTYEVKVVLGRLRE